MPERMGGKGSVEQFPSTERLLENLQIHCDHAEHFLAFHEEMIAVERETFSDPKDTDIAGLYDAMEASLKALRERLTEAREVRTNLINIRAKTDRKEEEADALKGALRSFQALQDAQRTANFLLTAGNS